MKITLFFIFSVCIVASASSSAIELYNFPKDTHTPEQLRNDGDELKKRVDCFLDKQPCTPLTAEYKKFAGDMVRTACLKCNPELKELARAFLEGVQSKHPREYTKLVLKYDPSQMFFVAFEQAVGFTKHIISSLPILPKTTIQDTFIHK